MFDEFKPGDEIATEKFIVTIPEDGTVIHYVVTLAKSGANAYGNRTCVMVHDDYPGTQDRYYDTRYETGCSTVESFREWAFNLLRKGLRPDCKIERAKELPPRPRKTTRKEYAVHFKSNDGKEEHVAGHYADKKRARASAETHKSNGNRDVYIVARTVTEWERVKA